MAATPAPPAAPPKPTWDPNRPEPPFPWLRPTIRIRLTLLYGGMFLIAGILLLSIIYLLAAQALRTGSEPLFKIVEFNDLKVTSNDCPGVNNKLSLTEFNDAISACTDHQRQVALDHLLSRSLLALLGLAVIAFAFGYAMAGRVLSPLGRITRTARAVAGSDLSRRIELDGPDDELKELADTFDDMLERLQRAFTAQQRFVGNASHELRTPLAINRTLLEVHLSDPGAPVELQQLGKTLLATNERSEQLVEGLLLLARSDNQIVERKPVDLAEVAAQAIDQVHAEAEAKGVEIRSTRAPAVVQGNGVLLERIALNLVQNAARYNVPEGGWVEVTTEVQHGQAVLVVSNTGPVVPAYEIDNLFEPFRRLRTERTGSDKGVGLGLSIVRSVARAHGGHISARPREGGGLVMRVTLPI
ncbi:MULTISPECIES: sensor histidine kinase [Streptomyces]|uniref:histidine kinase n=2 Tax=Streptomyces griseoaurantiacus TaxID=68213 RepID=A0A7W2DQ00_9ACTN|nr:MULTISPECIES: HAMP domain-containing sensor histidine kinase [Streptomyces]NJP71680.1 HAMP domain-containing histidine kinase [Streptomyces sp. C1-2]MBA5220859.1 HAMP domain-containing histidine kinase [Streptomyces griseoaurantiacus]MDX3086744.1 HAMP domain-containing sensor histidine kinase [Streptomyces sp. ME12-02E]MDX3330128.1 HAMP domain-containing sensor histidine kinase [Streptomyces sp. ME02-6978a]MDX3359261.1 HAMP domain-containing sensor histidine kinase [Streptomyces sp. ME02-69